MKKNRRILTLLSAFLITALLAACGTEKDGASSSSAAPSESAASQSEAVASAENETPAAEQPTLANFTATDLEGNEVTEEIFADYDLTMINIWATFCGPCLTEMPDLGELSQEYQEQGVQIVGIVMDVLNQDGSISPEMVETAKEVVTQTKANYPHLLPSTDLLQAKLMDVMAVPETIFVDREGNVVGKPYLGAKDKDGWKKIIDETLKEVK